MLGTIIIPTYSGHFTQASNLIKTIKDTSPLLHIDIIISKDDEKLFDIYNNDPTCNVKFIEDLVKSYSGVEITGSELLKGVGKFRFQALKKILGVFSCYTDLALVLDSETNIVRDLNEMFTQGLENTTVLYSFRDWNKIPESLTTEVRREVNLLLDQHNDYWFFESFNWIYDVNVIKDMLHAIECRFGKNWIFRNAALFECQLYYQYAFNHNTKYKFVRVENLFLDHFGEEYGQKIVNRFWRSSFTFCGMVEYAAHLMNRAEYIGFITDPKVTKHLRLLRHEPPVIYDVVDEVRARCPEELYFGEAAMYRGDFTRGKVAILISGEFHCLDNILNIKNFLSGVDCDIFVTTQKDSHLVPLIDELLSPIQISESDDELHRGRYVRNMSLTEGAPEYAVKADRDICVSNMFDKILLTYKMMKNHQENLSDKYSIVVRIRPDIFSVSRLKDIFLDVAEHSQVDNNSIFFPDRFWSQGINDQFFFGKTECMSILLENLSSEKYLSEEFLNPEYFLGKTVLKNGLKPIAFKYKYILLRNQQIHIDLINTRLNEQENIFWSKTIQFPCWKDLTLQLKTNLSNVHIKNSQLKPSRIFTLRRKDIEFFYGKSKNGKLYVFTCEHKSPYIFASEVRKIYIPFLSYLMVFGYPYTVTEVNNVTLKHYDPKTEQLQIEIDDHEQVLTICFPKPSFFAWLIVQIIKNSRKCVLSLLRRIRK